MKYDLSVKQTRSAKRVLNAFYSAMFELMTAKPFEKILVNELCEKSGYPRATFYNYFDDKYDLLNYFWQTISREIRITDNKPTQPRDLLLYVCDKGYDLCEKYKSAIKNLLIYNSMDSYVFISLKFYLVSEMKTIFENVPLMPNNTISREVMLEYYSNTIVTIFEWRFVNDILKDKKQTMETVKYLILNV